MHWHSLLLFWQMSPSGWECSFIWVGFCQLCSGRWSSAAWLSWHLPPERNHRVAHFGKSPVKQLQILVEKPHCLPFNEHEGRRKPCGNSSTILKKKKKNANLKTYTSPGKIVSSLRHNWVRSDLLEKGSVSAARLGLLEELRKWELWHLFSAESCIWMFFRSPEVLK